MGMCLDVLCFQLQIASPTLLRLGIVEASRNPNAIVIAPTCEFRFLDACVCFIRIRLCGSPPGLIDPSDCFEIRRDPYNDSSMNPLTCFHFRIGYSLAILMGY